jgi:Protein of unknown function (DUF2958)
MGNTVPHQGHGVPHFYLERIMNFGNVLLTVCPFLSKRQQAVITEQLEGEEREHFVQLMTDLATKIIQMPETYDQEHLGEEAIAHLHYFIGGCDWWITEKDKLGGVRQAFGMASLNHCDPELGYIGIQEITSLDAELDLHWTPKTLTQIKEAR